MSPRTIGLLLGLAAAAVTLILWQRGDGDVLDEAGLERALVRWTKAGPADYDLVVVTGGARAARHEVEVRDERVVARKTDGRAAEERLLGTWSVAGMFKTLKLELENRRRAARTYGVSGPDDVVLHADFDAEYGYPRHFLRHVQGQKKSIEWTIESFTPR